MALGRIRDGWSEIVGENVAARSEAVKLERGVLHVRAEGGVWATELTLLAASLASKADTFLGGGKVRDVRVNNSGGGATGRGDRGLKRR
jgi:predicted nucleic acid-binding Zn ribbon protein